MAGKIIEVNTSTLKNDVSTIFSELTGISNDIRQLQDTTARLSTMWDGSAKTAFISAVNDDIQRLEELIGVMKKFSDKVDTSRKEYEKCENVVSNIIASIKV